MSEHPIKQLVNSISVGDLGEGMENYTVGKNGITRIEQCTKSGQYANMPYLRVYIQPQDGDLVEVCLAEFCQHNIIGVYFNEG